MDCAPIVYRHPSDKGNPMTNPPRPTDGKLQLTEIHGPDGEMIVMPESPLEITRRVNLHAKLVAALEELHSGCVRCEKGRLPCEFKALLREAAK